MNEFSCIIDNKNNKSLETFGYEANTVHLSCDDDFDIGESMELSRKDKVKPLKRVSVPNVPQSGFIKATVSIQSKGDQAAFSPGKQKLHSGHVWRIAPVAATTLICNLL